MIKVKERKDGTLVIELEGEDHTLANLIAKTLMNMPGVKLAAYRIDHPLVSNPVVTVVTEKGVDPVDVVEKALKEVLGILNEIEEDAKRELGTEA